jgi:hypothetical protein
MAAGPLRLITLILVTMRRFLFLVLASCLVLGAQAQRVYFIYLQSENAAPFFVKMADKVYSSTSTGYVILSNLKDSTYTFSVGFPGGKVAETRFSVPINNGDRGFLLKNFENGLTLFDLQTLGVIKAMAVAGVPDNVQVVARTDAFTKLLAEAADDESLLYTTVSTKAPDVPKEVKKEPVPETKPDVVVQQKTEPKTGIVAAADTSTAKPEAEKPATETVKTLASPLKDEPKADTLVAVAPIKKEEVKGEEVKTDILKEEVKNDSVMSQPVQPLVTANHPEEPKKEPEKTQSAPYYKRSIVTKRSESSTTEGFGLVYLDHQEGATDTIRLLIPNPKQAFVAEDAAKEPETQKLEEPVKTELKAKADEAKTDEVKKDEGIKVSETTTAADTDKKEHRKTLKDIAEGLFKAPKESAPVLHVENSSCTDIATERDFLKVRKNMAAETNDEAMIEEAKVFFRSKCFTTEQIKNLSALFLTSAAKYQFYDAAYKHVTDPSKFPSLESEIKDPYYLKRFKALIGE